MVVDVLSVVVVVVVSVGCPMGLTMMTPFNKLSARLAVASTKRKSRRKGQKSESEIRRVKQGEGNTEE